jgi:hypothetical protein
MSSERNNSIRRKGAMADIKIDVGSYAGFRGEESPRVFFAHGEKITVLEVLRMWVEEAGPERTRKRFFVLKGSDNLLHKLYYDIEARQWFYSGFAKDPRKLKQP